MRSRPPTAYDTRHRSSRSTAAVLAIMLFVIFKIAIVGSLCEVFSQPQVGLLVHNHRFGSQHAVVLPTEEVSALRPGAPARVIAVNGATLPRHGDPLLHAYDAQVRRGADAMNAFVVERGNGEQLALRLRNQPLSFRKYIAAYPQALAFDLLGWIYALLGLFVWWRRPADTASISLLFVGLVAGSHLSLGLTYNVWTRALDVVRQMLLPIYAPALLSLSLRFTGHHRRPWARRWMQLTVVMAVGLASTYPLGLFLRGEPHWEQACEALVGLALLAVLLGVVTVSLRAAQSPNPLGLRRRARLLGAACLLGFTLPALGFLLPTHIHWGIVWCCLLVFPVLMAYASVRLGAFDLRLVVGQSLLYVLLSVSVLLGYLGLAYGGVRWLGQGELRTLPMGMAMAAFVVLLSLGQLRVQGAINRLVFRGRYVYADALAAASEHLARARRHDEILRTAEGALMGAMQLCRAALCTVDKDGRMVCVSLGNMSDPLTGMQPPELPSGFEPSDLAPVQRVLETHYQASAHDSQVTALQASGDPSQPRSPHSEAGFWPHYGIEWIVPLQLGRATGPRQVSGLLFLGPKRDGRPFDREDQKLIVTLANQLAVAFDNAMAFEEIERLKQGLEAQVERRTQELSQALVELERTQGQLIEQAKQATLGRLVAGIVHEVNSPLGALRSSADTTVRLLDRVGGFIEEAAIEGDSRAASLQSVAKTAPQLRSVLTQSSERIDRLMGSLKRFVGLDEAAVRDYDVREGIECALVLLAPRLGAGICVHTDFASHVPTLSCRPSRLNQVFLNLIDNAAKSIGGEGDIHIEVHRQADCVEVLVRDSGCGMDADTVAGLFEYGFSNRAGRVGMRLSLPTNRTMVEELGGEISVHSREGEGTEVRVRLPVTGAQLVPTARVS